MKRFIVSAIVGFALVAGLSCRKPEQGPPGAQGAPGPQGPAGQQGNPGPSGNANVKSYGPLYVPSFGWSTNDSTSWQAGMALPAITHDVLNSGSVQVFMQDSTTWWALPYSEADEYYVFGIEVGKVNVTFGHSHATKIAKPGPANFRVVVIPASAIQDNKQKNVPVSL